MLIILYIYYWCFVKLMWGLIFSLSYIIKNDDIMLYNILKTSYLKIIMTIGNTLNIFISPILLNEKTTRE